MRNKAMIVLMIAFFVMMMCLLGCSSELAEPVAEKEEANAENPDSLIEADTGQGSDTGMLVIYGLPDGELKLTLEEIMSMPSESGEALSISSSGEETITAYTGVALDNILKGFNVSTADYSGLRLLAVDGYSIEVPREILDVSRVILAYEIDGEPLRAKDLPLRVVIPDVRAMYWVRQLERIELIDDAGITALKNIDIFESMLIEAELLEEQNIDLVELLGLSQDERITLIAADGLIKTETLSIDEFQYFIQLDDEDSPLFYSPDLPRTMYVKKVAAIISGNRAVLIAEAFEEIEISGQLIADMLSEYLSEEVIIVNEGLPGELTVDSQSLSDLVLVKTADGLNVQ